MRIANRLTKTVRVVRNLQRQFTANPVTRERLATTWARVIRWQTIDRLRGAPRLVPLVNGLMLHARHGVTASTGVLYMGFPELESMAFVAHVLRREDTFVDVGANIGTYSIIAAGLSRCRVISIEPVPETYAMLVENLRLNGLLDLARAVNVAVADRPGTVRMTQSEDAANHVIPSHSTDGFVVRSMSIDEIVDPDTTTVLKMDIEGYESKAVAGARRLFENPRLAAVVMEFGCGFHHGADEHELYQAVLRFGFESFSYDPETRSLRPCPGGPGRPGNTIFVRDPDMVQARLEEALRVRVLDKQL